MLTLTEETIYLAGCSAKKEAEFAADIALEELMTIEELLAEKIRTVGDGKELEFLGQRTWAQRDAIPRVTVVDLELGEESD